MNLVDVPTGCSIVQTEWSVMLSSLLLIFVRKLIIPASLGFLANCILIASPGAAQDRPRITIDDVVDRSRPGLRTIGWLGSESLYARIRSTTGETYLKKFQAGGPAGLDLTAAFDADDLDRTIVRTTSIAPDGERLVSFVDGQWKILNLATKLQSTLIAPELPTGLPENFAWNRIDWAEDGGSVAISEMYDARGRSTAKDNTIEINGVRLQETASVSDRIVVLNTRLLLASIAGDGNMNSWVFPGCTSAGHSFSMQSELFVTLTCFEVDVPHTKIIRINPVTEEYEEIFRASAILQGSHPRISPDGKLLAFALNDDSSNWDGFVDLAIIDSKTGEIVLRLRPSMNKGLAPSSDYYWSADGKSIYVTARASGLDEIWSLSLSGTHQLLAGGDRRRYGMSVSPDGTKLSYTTMDGYGYRDVRKLDTETLNEEIYYVIDDPMSDFTLGNWQQIEWESTNGIRPKGWLITPPDFDPVDQYPLFVYVHGNGTGSDLYLSGAFTGTISGGPLEWHALATLGYIVFVPDYRMSGNYGPEPIKQSRSDQVDGALFDARDVITGVKHLISHGYVDPNSIAIMGHSLGGTRAFKVLIDEPGLFSAAILNDSSALDLRSMLEGASSGTRTGSNFNRFLRMTYKSELAEDPEPYKKNYVLDAVRIQTPTLFLRGGYGGEASPTKYASHETAFTLIRQAGVPARYITFVDEGHTYSTPEAALVAFDLVMGWMAEHMPARQDGADFVAQQSE